MCCEWLTEEPLLRETTGSVEGMGRVYRPPITDHTRIGPLVAESFVRYILSIFKFKSYFIKKRTHWVLEINRRGNMDLCDTALEYNWVEKPGKNIFRTPSLRIRFTGHELTPLPHLNQSGPILGGITCNLLSTIFSSMISTCKESALSASSGAKKYQTAN
jgi:hypothetical protein